MTVLVVDTLEMSDENLIRHINARHPAAYPEGQSKLEPVPRPDQVARGEPFELGNRDHWIILHERLHSNEWDGIGHRHE